MKDVTIHGSLLEKLADPEWTQWNTVNVYTEERDFEIMTGDYFLSILEELQEARERIAELEAEAQVSAEKRQALRGIVTDVMRKYMAGVLTSSESIRDIRRNDETGVFATYNDDELFELVARSFRHDNKKNADA